jgi:hypothetical protein
MATRGMAKAMGRTGKNHERAPLAGKKHERAPLAGQETPEGTARRARTGDRAWPPVEGTWPLGGRQKRQVEREPVRREQTNCYYTSVDPKYL